jgi:hypothetical protein
MADGNPILIGRTNQSEGGSTRINRPGGVAGSTSFIVESGNGYGVVGRSGSYPGVYGLSERSNGAQGSSRTGRGVYGHSMEGLGVVGQAGSSENSIGVVGVAASRTGWAGVFNGQVYVRGTVTAEDGYQAVARSSDGSLRQMYVMESPESWFEDLGRAEVVDGRAEVELDNEFAALVQTDGYHVFLTPEGDSQGLYVSARSSDRFEVREQQGGTSNLAFSYRVVAKRSDIEVERLQQIEAPGAVVDPLETPELPE